MHKRWLWNKFIINSVVCTTTANDCIVEFIICVCILYVFVRIKIALTYRRCGVGLCLIKRGSFGGVKVRDGGGLF